MTPHLGMTNTNDSLPNYLASNPIRKRNPPLERVGFSLTSSPQKLKQQEREMEDPTF